MGLFFSDPSAIVHTEMKLHPEEFDNYQIGVDTDITFCLKEARVSSSFNFFLPIALLLLTISVFLYISTIWIRILNTILAHIRTEHPILSLYVCLFYRFYLVSRYQF